MKVGLKLPSSSTIFLVSEQCASFTRAVSAAVWMTRASTCASGRNSSVEPESLNAVDAMRVTFSHSARNVPWVSTQPLGRPVVPEV